ncbi:MAG: hypothetical protein U5K38_01755 [Woeseiaceae bacterium]|nr:hypothetical protein [Woeseiaceae bacterium]
MQELVEQSMARLNWRVRKQERSSCDSVIEIGKGRFSFAVDTQPITFVSPVTPILDSANVERVSFEEEAEFSEDDIDIQSLIGRTGERW